MKRQITLLALLAALLLPAVGASAQEEMTVANGTTTNSNLPVWGLWLDNNTHTQSIYPASMLDELVGSNIQQLTWYLSSLPASVWTSQFTVRLMTTTASSFTTTFADVSDATVVYTGTLTVENSQITIELEEPFTYDGDNLLVDFQSVAGNYSSCAFYGTDPGNYTSIYARGSNEPTSQAFLPKLTIGYIQGSVAICRKPKNLTVSDIGANEATFSWEPQNGESLWHVYLDGVEVEESPVTSTSYTALGLGASSNHTFGVSAVCDDGSTSGTASTTFRTLCDVVSLPWQDDFDSYQTGSGNRPDCWALLASYSSYPYISTSNNNKCYYMYSNLSTPIFVATPMTAAAANQLHVMFRASVSSSGTTRLFEAGIMTDTADASTFIPMITLNGNSSIWTEYEFYTDTVQAAGNACVAFRWTNSGGNSAYIDDVAVEMSSQCRRPVSAGTSLVTYEGANVHWVDNGTAATGYTVRVATTNDVQAATAIDYYATSSPYTITGLSGNTTYYVWVSTNCGDEQTLWRSAGSFQTLQDCYPVVDLTVGDINNTSAVVTWNYNTALGRDESGVNLLVIDKSVTPNDTVEAFATGTYHFLQGLQDGHNYTVVATTACDTFASYSSPYINFTTSTCGRIEGTQTSGNSPFNGYYKYGYTQTIYPASQLQGLSSISGLQFRQASTPSGVYNRPIKVWIGNTEQDLVDTNDYVDIDDLTLVYSGNINVQQTGWKTLNFTENFEWDGTNNVVVAVQNLTGEYNNFSWGAHTATEGNTVYWYRDSDTIHPTNPNAPYNQSIPSRGQNTTVPDITFLGECSQPDCLAPIAAVTGTTETSVSLVWIAGSQETAWTVQYRIAGDTTWQTATASVATTSYTVGGLQSSTLYQFRVGSLCTTTLYGSTLQARTACGTISLPYTEDFESWNNGDFPACWYKTAPFNNYPYVNVSTSSTASHSGTGSMYIYGSNATGMFTSPLVPTNADNIKVTFWASNSYANPGNGTLKVGILTDPTDEGTFQECTATATGMTSGSWREWVVYTDDVNVSGQVHVAFLFQLNSSTTQGNVDDITISEAGNCRRPTAPSVSDVSYYSAMLHWTDMNHGSANYQVCYNTVNDLATATLFGQTTNEDSIMLTGLHNGHQYYAWVRQTCSTDDEDWLPMPTFTTAVSCYPVQNATMVGSTLNTITVSWDYNIAQGIAPQGALVSLMNTVDSSWVVENAFTSDAGYVFTGLTEGTVYRLYIATQCSPDTSTAVQLNVNTRLIVCGEIAGTSSIDNSNVPYDRYYDYSYCQIIYPAEQVAGLSTITGINFYSNTVSTKQYHLDVWIGTTDRTTFTISSYESISGLQKVATDFVHTSPAIGWTSITFDSAFTYDDTSNLIVVINNLTGSYNGSGYNWSHHSAQSQAIYWRRDNTPYTPTAITTGGTVLNSVPDIQFVGPCDASAICLAPVLSSTGTTTTSVSLQWGADATSGFTVQYHAMGDTTWIEAATNLATNSYTVSGLEASTGYQFRVACDCNGSPAWSNTVECYTSCDALSVPQTFTFSSPLSPCWTLTNDKVYLNSNALYFSYSSSNIGRAVLPELTEPVGTLMAVIRARYSYYSGSNYNLLVGVGNAQGGNVVWVDTITLATTYNDYYVYFDSYSGTDNRIVLSKDGSNYIYIESIEVGLDNGCHPTSAINVGAVTANTATLSWSHTSATTFEVQYSLDGTSWTSQTVNGTSVTLTGLNSSSSYSVRVRALCSDTDSSLWSSEVSFTTECGEVSLPWEENFNGWGSTLSQCWHRLSGSFETGGSTSTYGWSVNSSYGNIPIDGNALTMNVYYTNCYWVVSPLIDIDYASATLTFQLAGEKWSSSTANYFDNDDRFIVAISTDEGITWTPVYELGTSATADGALTDLTSDFSTHTVDIEGYNGQTIRLAFYAGSEASGGDSRLALDNIAIVGNGNPVVETCDAPTNLHTLVVDSTFATIQWTPAGSESQWQLIVDNNSSNIITTANTTYTLSNLAPGTLHRVSVRALCSATSQSDWSAELTFTTAASGGQQGIADATADAILLSPNPASNQVTIGGITGTASIAIVDQSGRTVYTATHVHGSHTVDLRTLAKGAYFVRIVGPLATTVRKLIVK